MFKKFLIKIIEPLIEEKVQEKLNELLKEKPHDYINIKSMTFDNYSNWFAHIHPNNKQAVIISYVEDQKQAHPFGKQVKLRLVNLEDKTIKDKKIIKKCFTNLLSALSSFRLNFFKIKAKSNGNIFDK